MPLIRPDLFFVEIRYELWALGEFLGTLERQIATLREQDERDTAQYLRDNGCDEDEGEIQLVWQEFDERQNQVIPRFLRAPFIVSLWAFYESATSEIAEHLRRKFDARLALADIRAANGLQQAKKYFEAVLDVPLDPDPERLAFIDDLRVVRNAIAHANGQRRAMARDKWVAVCAALTRRGSQADDYRGLIIPSSGYTREAYEVVVASVRELLSRARPR